MRAKLIANPGSGKMGRQLLLEHVIQYLMDQGVKVDLALAKPKRLAVQIAKKAVKNKYKLIIVMGGDDTIEAVIRGIAGSKVPLGIIPAGTENNVAISLGIPEDPREACALIAKGQSIKLDLGQIKINKEKFHFFEVVTIGLVSAVYPHVKEIPKGDLSSIKKAALTIMKHETKPTVFMELDDDSKIEIETMLVVLTNIPYIGLKFLVAPDASMQDGLIDISVFPEFAKSELFEYFGKVMNGGRTEDGKIQRYRAAKVKLKTSPELEVMADGIVLGTGSLKIKMRPGALKVIVPDATKEKQALLKEASLALPTPVSPAATVDVQPGSNGLQPASQEKN
ncbi:MAG: YegS/Rv2252/BmrU family lipid kinase [Anaerolineaceae bacterium]|nr:YegS/Rv2252/BmrU family lipid kinase [Anaerolineaceae bacterium]